MERYLYQEMYEQQNKHWWFIGRTRIILSMIDKYLMKNREKPIKILDIGCGTGKILKEISSYGEAYGMDSSEEAIDFCKQYSIENVKKGFLPEENPYLGELFDIILALDVLEHIDDDGKVLKCIYDMLSEDGIGIITVPAFMFLWSKHDELNHHKRRYLLTELDNKLREAGLKVQKISYFNFILFLPVVIVRMLGKIMARKSNKSDLTYSNSFFNLIFKEMFSFERHLLSCFNLPFGVSIIAIVNKI
ncbi:MAG: class I SAM-dependent methyltransferase [Ignavibacteriales bacterium]